MPHQPDETATGEVYMVAFGLALVVFGILLGMGAWFFHLRSLSPGDLSPARHNDESLVQSPHLQVFSENHGAGAQEADTRELNSFGMIDAKRGIAHIPIDIAMKKISE